MAVMVSSTSTQAAVGSREELVPEVALRIAWFAWLGFLAVPFVLFLYVCWALMDNAEPRDLGAPCLVGRATRGFACAHV